MDEKKRKEPVYFPLFMDISDKRFLIIGGGNIALRRIETLLDFTRNLEIVAPELKEELSMLVEEENLCWKQDEYKAEYLSGADFVLAATNDPACNGQVVSDCKKRGIPANAAHKKELCDFYFPSIVRKENLVVGICGSGQNHSQVKETRIQIQKCLQSEEE